MAFLQPAHQSGFSDLTQIIPGSQGDEGEHNRQADQGETVVGDFKKALGNVSPKGSQALGSFS